MNHKPLIFISYSHRDEAEKNDLLAHLEELHQNGFVVACHDHPVDDPIQMKTCIPQALASARVALLLITANYLNSEFVLQSWWPELLQRQRENGLMVFSMLARPCAWRAVDWLRQFNNLPADGRSVWSNGGLSVAQYLAEISAALANLVAEDVEKAIREARILEQEAEQAPMRHSSGPWKVLVVDKETSWSRRLTRVLGEINCRVVAISHYQQIVRAISDQHFDLIIIDPNLEKRPGQTDHLGLLPQIREMAGEQTPLVILSSAANLELLQPFFETCHIFEAFQKTKLDYQELQQTVRRAINTPLQTGTEPELFFAGQDHFLVREVVSLYDENG